MTNQEREPTDSRDCDPCRADLAAVLTEARVLAAGIISGGVVHEVANLLTVVDGLRQMAAMGMRNDAGLSLMDEPAGKCQLLVEAFRAVFSERGGRFVGFSVETEAAGLKILLGARLRGRPTRVEIAQFATPLALGAETGIAARLALLCGTLALLEPGRRGGRYPSAVVLSARGDDGDCSELEATIHGFEPAPTTDRAATNVDRLVSVAERLMRAVGGRLAIDVAAAAETATVRVLLRA